MQVYKILFAVPLSLMPISAMIWDFDNVGTYIVCNNYEFAA
jgi:hypothetical protein